MSTTAEVPDKKKRNLLFIIYIHILKPILKSTTWFFWNIEVLLMNRMSDGHIPMATNQTRTGGFWQCWFSSQQSPSVLRRLNLHHVDSKQQHSWGTRTTTPTETQRKATGRKRAETRLAPSASVQRTQCLRLHAKWDSNVTRGFCMKWWRHSHELKPVWT